MSPFEPVEPVKVKCYHQIAFEDCPQCAHRMIKIGKQDSDVKTPELTPNEIAAQCWCDPETSSIVFDHRLALAFGKRLQAEREKLKDIEAELDSASRRSSYPWSEGGYYTSHDWTFEGKIELARQLLEKIRGRE